ncbi:MAG: signal peptide peptidase SppA [Flavobacteriaceae bacterium]|jgi:protease-4|nr:signal peptide peptidase SppA [Flavobacteriaceae bacterium]
MKKFIIQVLATVVGILLVTGLFVFGLIFLGILSSDSSKIDVEDNSVLEITLNKSIMENPNEREISIFSLEEGTNVYLKEILDLIKHAKTDDKIKGISLKLSYPEGGYSEISEIRQALVDFKKSKKFVYSYSNDCSQKAYYLASVADSLFLNPNATVELAGLSTEILFYKNLGEKYGIDFEVIRHGQYKSAVEPYIRENLSDENRLQLSELLGNIWLKVSGDIASSRKISIEKLNTIADSLYGFIPELALEHKLADKLINESEYDQVIKRKLGIFTDEKINKISLAKYKEANDRESYSNDKIAVLYATGQIYTGRGEEDIYSKTFIKQIKEIKKDDEIKAVVLRVNSPGGSANASSEILYELEELKKKKPLIVSFSDVAASGGYYISMAADKIYAQENTITGSIGVLGMIPNVKKLANNVGITSDHVSTNANSLYYSMTQGTSGDLKNVMTKGVEMTYKKFVGVVMKGRKMTYEQVDALGGGRVWSGKDALKNKLVDEIGTFDDAIAFAAKKSGLTEYGIISYPQEKSGWESFLNKIKSEDEDDEDENIRIDVTDKLLEKELGKENYRIYQKVKNLDKEQGVKYLMPFDLAIK